MNLFKSSVCRAAFLLLVLISCKKNDQEVRTTPTPPVTPPVSSPARVSMVLKPVTTHVTIAVDGYYIGLPSNYDSTNTSYPLLIYVPGAGQFGNGALDLPLLLKDGPAQVIDEKKFPATITSGGKTYSFIVFTPQLAWWASDQSIADCISFAKSNYRVDSSRIYLSGLSIGGTMSVTVGSSMANKIAAIVPMAGFPTDYMNSFDCQNIAKANLPVWEFHSQDDPQFSVMEANGFISRINSFNPSVPAKITVWPNGGHDAWTRALNPDYRENGMNIYEWMLQYHR